MYASGQIHDIGEESHKRWCKHGCERDGTLTQVLLQSRLLTQKPRVNVVRKFEQPPQSLLIETTQLETRLIHKFDQNSECEVLLILNANQNQTRQVIHALAVADIWVMLTVGDQNVIQGVGAIGHVLGEEFFVDEGAINVFLDLSLVL